MKNLHTGLESVELYSPGDMRKILSAAGFELKERNQGLYVCGHNCTIDGVTYICAHDGRGWYPAERIAKVIMRTAPISE